MGLRDRIANGFGRIAQAISSKQTPEENRLTQYPAWYSTSATFREWSTKKAVKEGLESNVWVYACVRKISEAVSSVPWYVEKSTGEEEWERVKNHPVEQLLRNPAPPPMLSGKNLFKLETNHRQLGGNALWWKNIVGGQPVELWPIKPDQIQPKVNDDGTLNHYEYRGENQARKKKIPPEELIHFLFTNPDNFYWGLSPLKAASRVVDSDVEAVRHNKKLLENSAISSGAFSYNDNLKRDQWEEARERVREHMKEPGLPWILGNDADWNQMSYSVEDLQILEQRKWNALEIHAAFDVDPLLTSIPDTGGQVNKKEAKKELWQDNIISYLESLKNGLENNLLVHWDNTHGMQQAEEHDLRLVYDVSNIKALQEDRSKKIADAQKLYRMNVPFNRIDERLELGIGEVPGGDTPREAVQQPPALMSSDKPESQKMTDHEKTLFWKSVEEDRQEWENQIVNPVKEEFEAEIDEIDDRIESVDNPEPIIELLDNRITDWRVIIENSWIPVLEYFGQEELERLAEEKGIKPSQLKQNFDAQDERIQEWVRENAVEQATLIQQTSKDTVRQMFQNAKEENLTVDELGRKLRDQYDIWTTEADGREFYRAMRVARTETQMAQGKASFEGAVQAEEEFGFDIEKTWITSRDARVRDIHSEMDGETVPLRRTYSNGLEFPGDPSGVAEQVIHCRCTEKHSVVR